MLAPGNYAIIQRQHPRTTQCPMISFAFHYPHCRPSLSRTRPFFPPPKRNDSFATRSPGENFFHRIVIRDSGDFLRRRSVAPFFFSNCSTRGYFPVPSVPPRPPSRSTGRDFHLGDRDAFDGVDTTRKGLKSNQEIINCRVIGIRRVRFVVTFVPCVPQFIILMRAPRT